MDNEVITDSAGKRELLRVENLCKSFGGVRAVSNVTFSVELGERLFIIGPNGAGKTTLFNLLSGHLPVTSGRICFMSEDVTRLPTYKRAQLGLSRSYQITSLFPRLTAFQSAKLAVQGKRPFRYELFRPMSSYEELADRGQEALRAVGLLHRKDEEMRNLSHGEQRRLEIALSLASEPKLLMLDEPTAGLTTGESVEIADLINSLDEDLTIIVIAHDIDFVFGVARRILVMHLGQCLVAGDCEEIRKNPMVKEIYMGSENEDFTC